jgi:hypothetical protein
MSLRQSVTPAEAEAVWENISEPNTRRVDRALSQQSLLILCAKRRWNS